MFPSGARGGSHNRRQAQLSVVSINEEHRPRFESDETHDRKAIKLQQHRVNQFRSEELLGQQQQQQQNIPPLRTRSNRLIYANTDDLVSLKSNEPWSHVIDTEAFHFSFVNFEQPMTDPSFFDLEWSTIHIESKASEIYASQSVQKPTKKDCDKSWRKGEKKLNFIVKGKGVWYLSLYDSKVQSGDNKALALTIKLTAHMPKISFSHVTKVRNGPPEPYLLMPRVPYHFFSTKSLNGTMITVEGPPELIVCLDSYRPYPNTKRHDVMNASESRKKKLTITGVEGAGNTFISVYDPKYRTRLEKEKATFSISIDRSKAQDLRSSIQRLDEGFLTTKIDSTAPAAKQTLAKPPVNIQPVTHTAPKPGKLSPRSPRLETATPKKLEPETSKQLPVGFKHLSRSDGYR